VPIGCDGQSLLEESGRKFEARLVEVLLATKRQAQEGDRFIERRPKAQPPLVLHVVACRVDVGAEELLGEFRGERG
jgi:hypothetical protein